MKTLATIGFVAIAAVAVLFYLSARKQEAIDAANDVVRERTEHMADQAKVEAANKSLLEREKADTEAAERVPAR
jgi:hypothetical protein